MPEGSRCTAPPLVLHVPHSSSCIPGDALGDFQIPLQELASEHLRICDHYTEELYLGQPAGAGMAVVATVSRLVVDVERFPDDATEPAAAVGMGATYVKTTAGAVLRHLTAARRLQLLEAYYWPHHARLDELTLACLASHGRCLLLDCHSFPTGPLPTQQPGAPPSPEVCIGTDPRHTSPELQALAVSYFRDRGFEVAVDHPFAGALVPNAAHARGDAHVQSVMVELRRDLYMNERTGVKLPAQFAALQQTLRGLRQALEGFVQYGDCAAWRAAPSGDAGGGGSGTDGPRL